MRDEFQTARAIRQIAMREGITADEVRNKMKAAIRAGMDDPDPAVRSCWQRIPHSGNQPTPEELIVYLTTHLESAIDPFA